LSFTGAVRYTNSSADGVPRFIDRLPYCSLSDFRGVFVRLAHSGSIPSGNGASSISGAIQFLENWISEQHQEKQIA